VGCEPHGQTWGNDAVTCSAMKFVAVSAFGAFGVFLFLDSLFGFPTGTSFPQERFHVGDGP
jgi:hypothetical protein